MKVSFCFSLIAERIKKLDMVKSFRDELVCHIEYFILQCGLPLEQRDVPITIRNRFLMFENSTRSLGVLDEIKKNDEYWRIIKAFTFYEEPCSLVVPKIEKAIVAPPSKFEKWDVYECLYYISRKVPNLEEFRALKYAMMFLASEAKTPRGKRSSDLIKATWLENQPVLAELGILEEFRAEKKAMGNIKLFVEGTL